MSKRKNPEDKKGKKQPTGDYPVGYCRTDEKTRWKKGCASPNPGGRPKGRKSMEECIYDELGNTVAVTTANGKEMLEIRKAAAKRYVEQLLKNFDLKHYKDAFRIDAEQAEKRQIESETGENPVHSGHRLLALMLFPYMEDLTPEQMDEFLYPDGKFPL